MSDGSPPARRPPPPPGDGDGAPRRSETRQVMRRVETGRPRTATGSRPAAPRPPGSPTPSRRPAAAPPTGRGLGAEPRLVFTAGPRSGEELTLTEAETVLGRSNDVTVPIADTSVSRRHLALRKSGLVWTAQDLGSGNGTLVNGEPIDAAVTLGHGDVVTLGETEFTFTDEGDVTGRVAVAPPSSRPARPSDSGARRTATRVSSRSVRTIDPAAKKKKRLLLAGVTFAALLIVGGAVAAKLAQDREAQLKVSEARARAEAMGKLEGQMQEARNLIRQSQWKEAKAVLEKVKELAPSFQNVGDLLARAEVEIPNQEQLEAAEKATQAGELAKAQAALKKVSADTAMFERVSTVKRGLDDKARVRLVEANDLMRASKFKESLVISEDVLAAFPEDRDAQLMVEQGKEGVEKGKVTPRANTGPTTPKRSATEPAVAKFMEGDLTGAAAMLNACADERACKEMLKDVAEFGKLYKSLDNLDERGLSRLLALDREITGGAQSKLAKVAGTKAGGIYMRTAQSFKASGRWDKVRLYVAKALQANPGLAEAKKLNNELEDRAQQTYLSGYSLKDTDPDSAIEKFRDVLQMTAPGDELHGKAKNWLEKLGR